MDFFKSVQGEQKCFNPNTAQVSNCQRQESVKQSRRWHPGGHQQQIPTTKRGGKAARSKLFHQIIGGRANVSFGRLIVKVCQKQKQWRINYS